MDSNAPLTVSYQQPVEQQLAAGDWPTGKRANGQRARTQYCLLRQMESNTPLTGSYQQAS
jgi:hypothetical protein